MSNGRCETCDIEQQCGYPYKPTECASHRKFRPKETPQQSAAVIDITKLVRAVPHKDQGVGHVE